MFGPAFLLSFAVAADPAIDPAQQAPILARVLAYDRNLADRVGDSVVVAVLSRADDPASAADGKRVLDAFKPLEALPLKGKPFRVVALPWTPTTSLADAKARLGVDAVYLAGGLQGDVASITAQTRAAKLMSLSASEAYSALGASVGLTVEDGKIRLVINAAAAHEEGTQFSSDLLRLAKVLK